MQVQFQLIMSNWLCRQRCMCELTLKREFLPGVDLFIVVFYGVFKRPKLPLNEVSYNILVHLCKQWNSSRVSLSLPLSTTSSLHHLGKDSKTNYINDSITTKEITNCILYSIVFTCVTLSSNLLHLNITL